MAGENNIGATLWVSNALPATNTAAAFEALTWTQVHVLIEEPQFGISHDEVDAPNLSTGFVAGLKGAGTGASSEILIRHDASAPAQTGHDLLKTIAKGDGGDCSIKIGYGSGAKDPIGGPALGAGDEVIYAQGISHSYNRNKGTSTSYKGYSVTFRLNAEEIEATEPA